MCVAAASPQPDDILHASCVAYQGQAVVIRGASGTGKSSITLELLSRGARLVADDRTCLSRRPRGLIAYAPDALLGMIEVRFVGILNADIAPPTPVGLVIDLDQLEAERMPPPRSCDLLGQRLPLLHKADSPHFPSAVLHYLSYGPWTPS